MVSDLERMRQASLARNKALLEQLQLSEFGNQMVDEVARKKSSKPTIQKKKKPRRPKSSTPDGDISSVEPRRRSKRIAGHAAEYDSVKKEQELNDLAQREAEEREKDRMQGEMKLNDIMKKGDWESALNVLSDIGKVSQGDYFNLIKREESGDSSISKAREELMGLNLYEQFDPTGIKLTQERIISMNFHPSFNRKIIMAGDKVGQFGLWVVDENTPEEEDEEPKIYSFKVHSRAIAKILTDLSDTSKTYTCSYDGSIRCVDLHSNNSSEVFVFDEDIRNPIGISDLAMSGQPNILYYTTLEGQFGIHDVREKNDFNNRKIYRMHDKKIGGFAVNPRISHQCVTASLDRTFKVWDLRYTHKFKSELTGHRETQPHCYGEYHSRLSVSCADWNLDGNIVVNGYDDTINVFDLNSVQMLDTWDNKTKYDDPLKPKVRLKHNCQTGRWVSILKSRWHQNPRDGVHKFVIGNMNRYIDVYSSTGKQLAHLGHELMTAVPAVVHFHPTENWIVGGSASGKAYLWY